MLYKKVVHKDSTKFTRKHLCQNLFSQRCATLLKKRLWHRGFPVNFVKFLRIPFLQNTSGRLLLKWSFWHFSFMKSWLFYLVHNKKYHLWYWDNLQICFWQFQVFTMAKEASKRSMLQKQLKVMILTWYGEMLKYQKQYLTNGLHVYREISFPVNVVTIMLV